MASKTQIILIKFAYIAKTLYRLKQAQQLWYVKLTTFLIKIGFTNSASDSKLFTFKQNNIKIWILVYVNDLILTSNCNKTLSTVIQIVLEILLRGFGYFESFLRMEAIKLDDGSLQLTKSKYPMELLLRFRLSQCKSCSTPGIHGSELNKNDGV